MIVKELHLSRVFSQQYPSSSRSEDRFLQNFLIDSSTCVVCKDGYVGVVVNDGEDDFVVSPFASLLLFKVDRLVDLQCQELLKGEILKDHTSIILSSHHSILNEAYPKVVVETLLRQSQHHNALSPWPLLLPLPHFNQSILLKEDMFCLRFHGQEGEETLHDQLLQYSHIWEEFTKADPLIIEILRNLKSRVTIAEKNPSLQLKSGRFGVLIERSLLLSESDLKLLLKDCCQYLGIGFFQIDSKLLLIDQKKLCDLKTNFNRKLKSDYLFGLDSAALKGPNVIFFNELDSLLQPIVSSQSGIIPAETNEELFAKYFSLFLDDYERHILQESISSSFSSSSNLLFFSQIDSFNQLPGDWQEFFPITIPSFDRLKELTKELIQEFLQSLQFSFSSSEEDSDPLTLIESLTRQQFSTKETFLSLLLSYREEVMISNSSSSSSSSFSIPMQSKLLKKVLKKSIPYQAPPATSSNGTDRFSASQSSIAPVSWDDIGGLESVRAELLDALELPYKYPDYFPPHSPRRIGILLYGPPGTGKTLIAKAVATECKMFFLSIKGPELLDSYVGESEKNIRDLFQHALDKAPCVMFFDEIDSIAPARARGHDSGGGVMDRMVSQLLTEIDRLKSSEMKVFVIAATNRPDLLDPALLRPGRFDRRIYLGVAPGRETQQQILRSQLRKFHLSKDIDLSELVRLLPESVTGADLGSISSTVFRIALSQKIQQLSHQYDIIARERAATTSSDLEFISKESTMSVCEKDREFVKYLQQLSAKELEVVVEKKHFEEALVTFKPSQINLAHYQSLQQRFENI